MISAKDFSLAGDKYLGTPYTEIDCQAFVERCMRDCGLREDLPGSNAWYRRVMNNGWVGTPEECRQRFGSVPPGALLFILENDGKEPGKYQGDGIGNASHIGIYIGRELGAIHSSSSRGCVCYTKFAGRTIRNGGWNRVGLYNRFDFGERINKLLAGEEPEQGQQGGVVYLRGTVYSENGKRVNLRKGPGTHEALVDQFPVGTELTVLDYDPEWCKVIAEGMTGYMMTQFIRFDGEVVPGEGDKEPAEDGGDQLIIRLDPAECSAAYSVLKKICELIEQKVGRG